ncbi:MAG TPA: DUF1343 domain-containing protein [Gemmatimonadales bacterium]|jgi:uncharacterized protein YbbC (DUF1343 family)
MHRTRFRQFGWLILAALIAACGTTAAAAPAPQHQIVRPGIDVLLTDSLHLVRGKRVGLVTNVAAVDARGVSDIARIRGAGITLVALFAPEHGLTESAAPGERVATRADSGAGTPIYSLYGRITAPTDSMLRGIDVLLVDLPDVGARYYTYLATTVGVLQAAATHRIPVMILDRPNPLGGVIEGNILDTAFASMVGRLAVPIRHGLTLGEEARLAAADLRIPAALSVIPVAGWQRSILFDETGLPFRAPSPNLQTLDAVRAYPGTCLLEGTALSVGRGTEAAFLQIGAPWLDTTVVLRALRDARLPGVAFHGVTFRPHAPGDAKFAETAVDGIRLVITDPHAFRPVSVAVNLLAILQRLYPDKLAIGGSFDRLAGGPGLREAILRGESATMIIASWRDGLVAYRQRAAGILLYPGALE